MTDHGKYDDIIHLPHHVSSTRPRMSMTERAAQFSPFAALTGHDEAIQETGRVTAKKIDLDEDEKEALDREYQLILFALEQGNPPSVTITYFQPDLRKDGGEYLTITGKIKKIDNIAGCFCMTDERIIPFDAILKIIIKEKICPLEDDLID